MTHLYCIDYKYELPDPTLEKLVIKATKSGLGNFESVYLWDRMKVHSTFFKIDSFNSVRIFLFEDRNLLSSQTLCLTKFLLNSSVAVFQILIVMAIAEHI